MNFSLSSRLVRPRAEDRNRETDETNELVCSRRIAGFPPAGGGRGSEQREGESQCFLGCRHRGPCMFHLRVHVSRADVWRGGGSGLQGVASARWLGRFSGEGESECVRSESANLEICQLI